MRRRLLDAVCAVLERADEPEAAAQAACESLSERQGVRLAAVLEEPELGHSAVLALWPEADRMLVAHPECGSALSRLLAAGTLRFGPGIGEEAVASLLAAIEGEHGQLVPLLAGKRRMGALLVVTASGADPGEPSDLEPLARALGVTLVGPAQRRATEKALQEKTRALRERVKELACLVQVSKLSEDLGEPFEEKAQRIACVLPSAFRYAETACARVLLEGRAFVTPAFRETPRRLATPVLSQGQAIGLVEVFYRDHRPAADEGPFLAEERSLLELVAERLARFVEATRAAELVREREETLHTLLDVLPVAVSWGHEDGGRIEHTNRRLVSLLGYSVEDVPTLDDWFRLTCPDPDYRSRVAAQWARAVEEARGTGSIPALETTMVGKDGVARRLVVEGTLVRGRILAVFDELGSGVDEVDPEAERLAGT